MPLIRAGMPPQMVQQTIASSAAPRHLARIAEALSLHHFVCLNVGTGSSGPKRKWHEFLSRYNLLIPQKFLVVTAPHGHCRARGAQAPVIAYARPGVCASTACRGLTKRQAAVVATCPIPAAAESVGRVVDDMPLGAQLVEQACEDRTPQGCATAAAPTQGRANFRLLCRVPDYAPKSLRARLPAIQGACRVHTVEVAAPPASGHAREDQIARLDRIHFPQFLEGIPLVGGIDRMVQATVAHMRMPARNHGQHG